MIFADLSIIFATKNKILIRMEQYFSKIFKERARLTVFPVQTGAGKSYNIAKVLADNFNTKGFPQTFIVSPLWSLIDDTVIKLKKFSDTENDRVLVVKSNSSAWFNFFQNTSKVNALKKALAEDVNRNVIDDLIKRYTFLKGIRKIDNDQNLDEQSDSDFYNLLNEDKELNTLIKKTRNTIRRSIVAPFQSQRGLSESKKCEQCLQYHPYLEELFPELGFFKYRVICLTADKLHRYSYNIMRGKIDSYWSNIPNGSLVIMDESDQCKIRGKKCFEDAVLNHKSNEDEDRWALYHKLVDGIEKFEEYFNSDEDFPLHAMWVEDLYKELKKIADDSRKKLNLQTHLDGSQLSDFKGGLGVIYHDMNDICVNDNKQLVIEHREGQNRDYLVAIDNNAIQKETRLGCNYADNGITYLFRNVMRKLNAYINRYEEQESFKVTTRERMSMQTHDQILRDFLNALGIDKSADYNVLKNYEILHGCNKQKSKTGGFYSKSIYDEGISLTEIQEKNGSRRSCKMNTMCLTSYPEHVIIDLVKNRNCHVFLSSATADIKDPLHNYDLEYLEKELGAIHYMDDETQKRVQEAIDGITPHCDLNVVVLPTDGATDYLEDIKDPRIKLKISNFNEEEGNDYLKCQFNNLLQYFSDFSKDENAHAGLVVTPFIWHKKLDGVDETGKDKLQRILSIIGPDVQVFFLSGKTLNQELKNACDVLKDNSAKVMCFICHNSGSVGINYEYEVTSDISNFVVAQNRREGQNTCNFDSIYIEHPTNYIELTEDPNSYIRSCFDISMLAESKYINVDNKQKYISMLLKQRIGVMAGWQNKANPTYKIKSEIYEKYPYREYCIQQAAQSLGRLGRTPISRKKLNVYLDDKMAQIIAKCSLPTAATEIYRNVRRELTELYNIDEDTVKLIQQKTEEERIANDYDQWNRRCSNNITTLVSKCNCVYRNPGQEEILRKRNELKLLNDLFLTHPQVEDLSVIPGIRQGFYKKVEEIPTDKKAPTEVSHLDVFMRIECIRNYFLNRGYCINPPLEAKYWISDAAIQQLYLPRIAEYAFKALMENVGLTVYDLPDYLYEKADWVVIGNNRLNRLYVDVKYWAPNENEQNSDGNDWAQKADLCGDGLYVIVNVPIYPGLDSRKVRHERLSNGRSLVIINGLINIETGDVDQESCQNIYNLLNQ